MTAPESVAEAHEVDVVAQLEGDVFGGVPTFNAGVWCGITRLRGLGYSEGTPVPTAAHYAALKEAAAEVVSSYDKGNPFTLAIAVSLLCAALDQSK